MKKNKKILILFILVIFGVLISRCMPFLFVSNYSIKEVKISREPNGKRYLLNEEEKKEFVKILRRSILLNRDESYRNGNGIGYTFYITKRNGEKIVLMEFSQWFMVNGTGYKSMQTICDNYTELGQKIMLMRNKK